MQVTDANKLGQVDLRAGAAYNIINVVYIKCSRQAVLGTPCCHLYVINI